MNLPIQPLNHCAHCSAGGAPRLADMNVLRACDELTQQRQEECLAEPAYRRLRLNME